MAGIDKMYLSVKEKEIFIRWFVDHFGINLQGQEMLENMTIYDPTQTVDNIHAVTNYSKRTDKYLRKHCKLPFIQKRLDEQYGKNE